MNKIGINICFIIRLCLFIEYNELNLFQNCIIEKQISKNGQIFRGWESGNRSDRGLL